jgi:hypothetical protein
MTEYPVSLDRLTLTAKGEIQKWQEFKCLLAQVVVASFSLETKPYILRAQIAAK